MKSRNGNKNKDENEYGNGDKNVDENKDGNENGNVYLIAGAGIAGLYTAYNINKHFPDAKICILEASSHIGGRLSTLDYDGIQVDSGGARFNNKQHRILNLIKILQLNHKQIPITNDATYIAVKPKYNSKNIKSHNSHNSLENTFPSMDIFIKDMQKIILDNKISRNELINTTILDLSHKYYSKVYPDIKEYLISINPYYSELAILNALEGINLFTNEFSNTKQYYILNGGLQQITDTLYKYLKNKPHITILTNTPLTRITELKNNTNKTNNNNNNNYTYKIESETDDNIRIFRTKNIILALPQPALLKIKFLTSNKNVYNMLNSIKTEPLYRIFARYPTSSTTTSNTSSNTSSKQSVWFDKLPKIITNLPIKYIIPINTEKGIIMISYTDSKFAKYWMNKVANGTFETSLNKQLKLLFPDKYIPKAKWFKHCPWDIGAGYWKPGIDRNEILHKIIKPLSNNNIYICGENYSSHQAWVEGALETSDMVLHKLGIKPHNTIIKHTTTKHTTTKHTTTKNMSNIK